MNSITKKILIIGGSSLAAVGLALLAVFMVLKIFSAKPTNNDYSSSLQSSDVSSEIPDISDEQASSSVPAKPVDNGIRLVISSPTSRTISTTVPEITFSGTSDKAEPLTVNGTPVERSTDGIFTFSKELSVGKNTFTFVHKGETKVYTVTYRYVIINTYSPSAAQKYPSGSTLVVNVTARPGSVVKAAFNGQTVALTQTAQTQDNSEFVSFNGGFTLPGNNVKDLNLGKITYTATHAGKSESFQSGNITCLKSDIVVDYDPNATPAGGKYLNVGSGYIAEIVEYNAETFDGAVTKYDDSIDWSRPTNNYLPKGTVDYCSTGYVNYKDINYVTLRAGYRVYLQRKDKPNTVYKPVVKQYIGNLPDHNEITVSALENDGAHTKLSLDCLWKAPFYFDLHDQKYNNPAKQDYTISSITYNYIDITFCYATVFNGEVTVPEDNPLFASAQLIKGKSDCTLRLILKKQGAFYGWDSYYNANGQLCFEFLNPKTVMIDETIPYYGVNLNGAKILIDVGHGGIDCGAPGFDVNHHSEAIQNLFLANKIKAELESIGAQVFLTRTGNTTSSTDDKITKLRNIKPDYCIAIHHNSSAKSSPNGFGAYHFNAFSKKAAEFVYVNNANSGIYKSSSLQWHYYYMARTTTCPVVLTENGYISNLYDYNNIISDAVNTQKAKAIAKGIAEYFKFIQPK